MVGIKSVIGIKGQVVIPKQLREEFELFPGATVEFDQEDGRIILKKSVKRDPVRLLLEIKQMIGEKLKREDLKKLDWNKLYEEEIEERNDLKKWKI